MIESYVDAYAEIYGDDTDAYVEEIVADTYAGMNRTDYGTNKLRADVKMEVGQWQKKSGSARAPPVKMSAAKDQTTKNYQGVNLAEDGSVYTYDFLTSLPDMDVTMLPEVDAVRGADNRVDTAKVVQEGMKNARAVGTERDGKVFVRNRYTGKLLMVTTSSVRHGLYGEANRLLTNARLGAAIGEIVKNAVPVNALKNEAKNVVGTYAMAAYAEDTVGRQFSAVVTVEQRTGAVAGVEVYDVTHAVSGRQKRSERVGTKPQGFYPSTNASSKITIADFLKIVNRVHQSVLSQDVMDHFGETKDQGGYYTDRVKFSSKEGRYRDLMGEKAAQYTRRAENFLLAKIAGSFGVSSEAKRETLQPFTEQIVRKFLQTGELDNKLVDDLVDAAAEVSMEENQSYYEAYKGILKFIENQKISIPAQDKEYYEHIAK